jgi:hypothetical protein
MWQKIKCWLGWHELIDCCDYCCDIIKDADCGKCSYFLFREKIKVCKHCGKVKK